MRLVEIAELVYNSFERCLDLDLSFRLNQISDEDRRAIEADEGFRARVDLFLYDKQAQLFERLDDLSENGSEAVSLQATLKLGEMLYQSRFGKNDQGDASERPLSVVLVGGKAE